MDTAPLTFARLKHNTRHKRDGAAAGARIAVLADSASQLIVQAIEGYGLEHNVLYDLFEAGYDETDRQVFDSGSDLYRHAPDFVIIFRHTEKMKLSFYGLPVAQRSHFAVEQLAYMESLYQALQGPAPVRLIVSNLPEWDDNVFGSFAHHTDQSFLYQLRKFNVLLMEWAQSHRDLYICDVCTLVSRRGYEHSIDERLYIQANMVFDLEFLPLLAKSVHDMVQSLLGRIRKCIILDLDNTLWGGVIGDDGPERISIGQLGVGRIFSGLQRWVLELSRRGVIVAICSKNSEEAARAPFIGHPEMVLRLKDIAVFMANWENKVDNIKRIGEILHIGLDSMVFIDDSPFEREMVRSGLPEVTVPELPEDPACYLTYLQGLNLFEGPSITQEDGERGRQYQEEAKRVNSRTKFFDEHEFLKSLEMKSAVRPFDDYTIPRVAQLAQRSNQFNLRTVRYTQSSLAAIAADACYLTLSFTLEDIYGEYGLISAVVLHREENYKEGPLLFIENWMMSCRVLRRGMEVFVLQQLERAAREAGYSRLEGEYLPSSKNGLVAGLYQQLGFSPTAGGRWRLELEGEHAVIPHFITKKESINYYDGKTENYTNHH